MPFWASKCCMCMIYGFEDVGFLSVTCYVVLFDDE